MPLVRMIKNIAFFGYSEFKEDSRYYQEAEAAAKMLAEKGYTIVNGGGPGIMAAATHGAEIGGGETIAITFLPKDAPGFEGRYLANRVDKEIKTKNYIERMFKLMEHADAYIIFKGGEGTISELGTAWVLARLYYPHHKPFILYGKFWHKIIQVIKANMKIRESGLKVFKIVENQTELLEALATFEKEIAEYDHNHCEICQEKAFMN